MTQKPRPEPSKLDYEIRVVGAPRTPLRDFYHALLRLSWAATLGVVAGGYCVVNALFALIYLEVGGIANARPGSFADAFYFSVETMGTIGYGVMAPQTDAANVLMVVESTLGLVLTALATGLVFAKFSRPTARLMFSRRATISPMNGVPTLAFRLGNLRKNLIVEATVRVSLVRTERTLEGKDFYRMLDLKLARDHILSLSRAWTVLHAIDEASPLHGDTPDSLARDGVEILVTVSGMDDTWMQIVHASHRYLDKDIAFGARLSDVLTDEGAILTLDLTRFDAVEPTEPTESFPFPRAKAQ